MLALDLCCGTGGWSDGLAAAGFDVVGVDISRHPSFAHHLVIGDVRSLSFKASSFSLVVASPPCEQFSRHSMPWLRAKNPPPPDTSIWFACVRIAKEQNCPLVIENVCGAQPFMGRSVARWGSRFLWGDVPPLLPPVIDISKKNCPSKDYFVRAHIPFVLSSYIGACFYQQPGRST